MKQRSQCTESSRRVGEGHAGQCWSQDPGKGTTGSKNTPSSQPQCHKGCTCRALFGFIYWEPGKDHLASLTAGGCTTGRRPRRHGADGILVPVRVQTASEVCEIETAETLLKDSVENHGKSGMLWLEWGVRVSTLTRSSPPRLHLSRSPKIP